MPNPDVRGGGGVVWRNTADGRIEVVLVHHSIYAEWTLPKGKQDPGEDLVTCALREVQEETGLACETDNQVATVHYRDRLGRQKAVHYWAMQPKGGHAGDALHALNPSMEIDDARWASLESSLDEVDLPRDHLVLWAFAGQVAVSARMLAPFRGASPRGRPPLILLRHASAGERDAWDDDDRDRPLDAKGVRQSAALAAQLSAFPVERIISSPAARCIQSVEPLAAAIGIEVEIDKRLSEGKAAYAEELVGEPSHRGVVLCTHGDVLDAALSAVARSCNLPLPGDGTVKKASVWAFNGNGNDNGNGSESVRGSVEGNRANGDKGNLFKGNLFKIAAYLAPPVG